MMTHIDEDTGEWTIYAVTDDKKRLTMATTKTDDEVIRDAVIQLVKASGLIARVEGKTHNKSVKEY